MRAEVVVCWAMGLDCRLLAGGEDLLRAEKLDGLLGEEGFVFAEGEEIAFLEAQAGKRLGVLGGTPMVRRLAELGLVDELVVKICLESGGGEGTVFGDDENFLPESLWFEVVETREAEEGSVVRYRRSRS